MKMKLFNFFNSLKFNMVIQAVEKITTPARVDDPIFNWVLIIGYNFKASCVFQVGVVWVDVVDVAVVENRSHLAIVTRYRPVTTNLHRTPSSSASPVR